VILAGGDALGVILQLTALGRDGDGAFGGSSQAGDSFRDLVDLFQDDIGQLVEQLVQSDKIGAFDVPMRLLYLALQIDGVGQPIIQYDGNIAADFLRQIDLRFVHGAPLRNSKKPKGYFALLWRRIPRKKVMSGAGFTAASSAKPNSMRQRSLRRRIAPTVSCKLGPKNRRLLSSTRPVWPSSCARSDHSDRKAQVAAKRANRRLRLAPPGDSSSPKGCAKRRSAANCQARQRQAPCDQPPTSQAPSPLRSATDPVGASKPAHRETV